MIETFLTEVIMDADDILRCVCRLWVSSRNRGLPAFKKQQIQQQMLKIYALYVLQEDNENPGPARRQFWVRPIFTEERRLMQGASDNLARELEIDPERYFNYFRMSSETFQKLLQLLEPVITKETVVRTPISARTRLQVTLRYLASGDSMTSISYAFRIAHNTVSKIVSETCEAIWDSLKDTVFVKPSVSSWEQVADDFEKICNFPHCIGAPDGKHVVMQVYISSWLLS